MRQFRQSYTFGSRLQADGITASQLNQPITGLDRMTKDYIFANGYFGYSVIQSTGSPTMSGHWGIDVKADLNGDGNLKVIAGVTTIATTTSGFIPINSMVGTTSANPFGGLATNRANFIGIPRPAFIDVIGTSVGVGNSFGVVVTVCLGSQ